MGLSVPGSSKLLRSTVKKKHCKLIEGTPGVGPAQNVEGECKQNTSQLSSFYYEITWKPPRR